MAAPLLKLLGLPNFWLHINGRKNLAETPLLKYALSIYGNPQYLLRSFDSSPKNHVAMAVGLNDFPQGFDKLETLGKKVKRNFRNRVMILSKVWTDKKISGMVMFKLLNIFAAFVCQRGTTFAQGKLQGREHLNGLLIFTYPSLCLMTLPHERCICSAQGITDILEEVGRNI